MQRLFSTLAALALAGCASTVQLTLMPRDSGKLFYGTADGNGDEGRIGIVIDDKAYTGTWVQVTSARTTSTVAGGAGWYGRRGWGLGTVTVDNPEGAEAKALLTAPDGSGLRCDLRGSYGRGGGTCRDDKGRVFDVQIRPAAEPK